MLQALATFAGAMGWTVDHNAAYSGGWWLAVHKGLCYLNFVAPSSDDGISLYGATGFSSGSAPSAQAQTSPVNNFTPAPGPYAAYHFFSSTGGTYLHVAIEISTGIFAHMHAGLLNAVGGASPCIYVTVSAWYTYAPASGADPIPSTADTYFNIRPFDCGAQRGPAGFIACTVDGTFRWFIMNSTSSPNRVAGLGQGSNSASGCPLPWQRSGVMASPNTFNGIAVLYSVAAFLERLVGGVWSFVGEAPDVRYVNMRYNNARDEITIGSDVWKLYPLVANVPFGTGVAGAAASSYPFGLAFKKSA